MAQAAAMLTGLFVLWLMLAPRAEGGVGLLLGAGAAIAAFGVSYWLMGAGPVRQGGRLRIGKFKRGRGVIGAALAPERLRPGFVKIKARDAAACAALARAAAANGAVIVEVEADGLLVHAIDEDAIEALGSAVEARAAERDAA